MLKEITHNNLAKELCDIGFDSCYVEKGKDKYIYKNFKIYSLNVAQANILKQIALSVGADCATHREVITGRIECSDVILGGSYSQLRKIASKLSFQPFSLKELGQEILSKLDENCIKTKIVGILNITDDSFSDGGKYLSVESAVQHFNKLIKDGADIIDIGAESTRPNAAAVSAELELERIIPVLERVDTSRVSIDTRKAVVAEECLKRGVTLINDVSGLKFDDNMASVISKYNSGVIIQHSKNSVNAGMNVEQVSNIVDEVYFNLKSKIDYAKSKGIKNIIIDVGIGFDKTQKDNIELVRRISEFKTLGYPVMLGVSRKSFLQTDEYKDAFSLAVNSLAIENGVDYIRVHNVKMHKEFLNLMFEIE